MLLMSEWRKSYKSSISKKYQIILIAGENAGSKLDKSKRLLVLEYVDAIDINTFVNDPKKFF